MRSLLKVPEARPMMASAATGVVLLLLAACAGVGESHEPVQVVNCIADRAPTVEFDLPVTRAGDRLVDQRGRDFQVRGDAAWSLIVQLTLPEVEQYLDVRKAQGFNTLIVVLIEHEFADDPPHNAAGDAPFHAPGDFSRPNAAYFDHADEVLQRAQERGFVVLLAPAYLGYEGGSEGWYQKMVAAGPETLRKYGAFVGERFRHLDNIVWLMGGDYTPPDDGIDLVDAVHAGIADRDDRHLFSAHWGPETSGSEVAVDWLDVDTTYTYQPVYMKSLEDHRRGALLPRIFIEGMYEHGLQSPSRLDLRAQAYHALLSGAQGHVYGEWDVWQMGAAWRERLHTHGACDMLQVSRLFAPLASRSLVPDEGALLIDGQGEWGSREYAVVAAHGDELGVVYIPSRRTVTLDLARFDGQVRARWFDPTTGEWRRVAGSPLTADSSVRLRTPGKNASGDGDWALVLEADNASAVWSAPTASR